MAIVAAEDAIEDALLTLIKGLSSCNLGAQAALKELARIELQINEYAAIKTANAAAVVSMRELQRQIVALALSANRCTGAPAGGGSTPGATPGAGGPLDFLATPYAIAGMSLPIGAWLALVVVVLLGARKD